MLSLKIILPAFLFFIPATIFSQQSKENIAVLDLDPTSISETDARFLSDRLRAELFESGVFQVVERDKMNDILQEQGFQLSGCTTVDCAVEAGQLLNVSRMVAGSIGQIEDIYSISVRLIDVESGAILKIATRDYRGKLSNVLTEVIPQVAAEIAGRTVRQTEIPVTVQKSGETESNKFTIALKGGLAGMNYTADLNEKIDSFADQLPDTVTAVTPDKYASHNNFGLELRYAISEKWQLKLGLAIQNMLSVWSFSDSDYDNGEHYYYAIELDRKFTFSNVYAGANYNIVFSPLRHVMHLGLDVGILSLNTSVSEYYEKEGYESGVGFSASNQYSALAIKALVAYQFYISPRFSLATELIAQYASQFDLSGESSDFEFFPVEFGEVLYPESIDASGVQFNLIFAIHF